MDYMGSVDFTRFFAKIIEKIRRFTIIQRPHEQSQSDKRTGLDGLFYLDVIIFYFIMVRHSARLSIFLDKSFSKFCFSSSR